MKKNIKNILFVVVLHMPSTLISSDLNYLWYREHTLMVWDTNDSVTHKIEFDEKNGWRIPDNLLSKQGYLEALRSFFPSLSAEKDDRKVWKCALDSILYRKPHNLINERIPYFVLTLIHNSQKDTIKWIGRRNESGTKSVELNFYDSAGVKWKKDKDGDPFMQLLGIYDIDISDKNYQQALRLLTGKNNHFENTSYSWGVIWKELNKKFTNENAQLLRYIDQTNKERLLLVETFNKSEWSIDLLENSFTNKPGIPAKIKEETKTYNVDTEEKNKSFWIEENIWWVLILMSMLVMGAAVIAIVLFLKIKKIKTEKYSQKAILIEEAIKRGMSTVLPENVFMELKEAIVKAIANREDVERFNEVQKRLEESESEKNDLSNKITQVESSLTNLEKGKEQILKDKKVVEEQLNEIINYKQAFERIESIICKISIEGMNQESKNEINQTIMKIEIATNEYHKTISNKQKLSETIHHLLTFDKYIISEILKHDVLRDGNINEVIIYTLLLRSKFFLIVGTILNNDALVKNMLENISNILSSNRFSSSNIEDWKLNDLKGLQMNLLDNITSDNSINFLAEYDSQILDLYRGLLRMFRDYSGKYPGYTIKKDYYTSHFNDSKVNYK